MPRWFLGKDLASLTVAPGTRDATTGVVTYGTANSLTGSVDYISFESITTHDQIMPVNAGKVHSEPILIDSNCGIGEIKKKRGNVLVKMKRDYQYLQATATTSNGDVYLFQGSMGRLGDGVKAMGKNTSEMQLLQYDDGVGGGLSYTEGT